MTPQELRDYCLAKPGAWPDQPREEDVVAKQPTQHRPG